MIGLDHYLILSVILFSLGLTGVLVRRNILVMLMSVEMMLNAANIAIVAFARYPIFNTGVFSMQDYAAANNAMVFVFLVLTVSAAEVGVGLAIVINIFRHRSIVNVDDATFLKG